MNKEPDLIDRDTLINDWNVLTYAGKYRRNEKKRGNKIKRRNYIEEGVVFK